MQSKLQRLRDGYRTEHGSSKGKQEDCLSDWESDQLRSHPDTAGVCWKISKQHGHKSNGQTISWSVQNINKIQKPEGRRESNEKPMRCRHGKAARDKERERSEENSHNLGIQCYILSVTRLMSFQQGRPNIWILLISILE